MTFDAFIEQLAHYLTAFATLVAAPLFLWLARAALPLLAGLLKSEKQRQAFLLVSRAGFHAINAAASEYTKAMHAAQSVDGPGGVVVTREEALRAMAIGVQAAINWLRDQHVLQRVMDVYGGEDAVRQALVAIANNALNGHEAAVTPVSPAMALAQLSAPKADPAVSVSLMTFPSK